MGCLESCSTILLRSSPLTTTRCMDTTPKGVGSRVKVWACVVRKGHRLDLTVLVLTLAARVSAREGREVLGGVDLGRLAALEKNERMLI